MPAAQIRLLSRESERVIARCKSLVDNGSGAGRRRAVRFALPAPRNIPARSPTADKNTPTLRAVAVFEWTGDEDHPKASRLVPICIYDGQDLEDAGVYLARPEPLALESDVEYQLQQDGKPVGLFDIDTAAREQGAWVGYGKWQPHAQAQARPNASGQGRRRQRCAERRARSCTASIMPAIPAAVATAALAQVPARVPARLPPDPDRPTLHKGGDASTTSSGGGSSQTTSGSGGNSGADSSAPPPDSDRPVLHRTDDSLIVQ